MATEGQLVKGLQKIKDPKTGQIYHKMPEPYEGQHSWVLYWIDCYAPNKHESWSIPVCFTYKTLCEKCAAMVSKRQQQGKGMDGSLPTLQPIDNPTPITKTH